MVTEAAAISALTQFATPAALMVKLRRKGRELGERETGTETETERQNEGRDERRYFRRNRGRNFSFSLVEAMVSTEDAHPFKR